MGCSVTATLEAEGLGHWLGQCYELRKASWFSSPLTGQVNIVCPFCRI